MQSKLIAGDSLSVLDTHADYPASAGWVLKYRFTPRFAGGTAIVLTSTAEGDSFRTTANSATTAAWRTGNYSFSQWVEFNGDRHTLETGNLEITPDTANLAIGTDTRSHLEKVVANLEAMIEGKATKDVQEYQIGDRQLKYFTISELIVWCDKYKFQLANEQAVAKGRKPGFGRKIYARF